MKKSAFIDQFDQNKFNNFILDNEVVGFFEKPVKLASGRESSWYVNWREVSGDVYLIDELTDFVLSFVEGLDIDLDCFYGTADGATKLAVLCQYKWAKSRKDFAEGKYVLSMGRKVPKEHGEIKDKYFIGAPRGNILVLEDVTTTGSSLINAVKVLQKLNFKVTGALSLTDRNELTDKGLHVSQILAALGVRYYSMSNAIDVLPKAVKKKKPARPVTDSIEEEFKKYGVDKIEL